MEHPKQEKDDVMAPGGKQQPDKDVLEHGEQQPGTDVMPDEGTAEPTT